MTRLLVSNTEITWKFLKSPITFARGC